MGGFADAPKCTVVRGCTPPAKPKADVYLGVNNSVSVGSANAGNDGRDLLHKVYSRLSKLCTGKFVAGYCDATPSAFTRKDIPTIVGDEAGSMDLGFTIPGEHDPGRQDGESHAGPGRRGVVAGCRPEVSTVEVSRGGRGWRVVQGIAAVGGRE
jgi:hypothetical protein